MSRMAARTRGRIALDFSPERMTSRAGIRGVGIALLSFVACSTDQFDFVPDPDAGTRGHPRGGGGVATSASDGHGGAATTGTGGTPAVGSGGMAASSGSSGGPMCGNGKCEQPPETCANCPGDCGACVCGNGSCDPGENCTSCP